jgi:hypothetical protein
MYKVCLRSVLCFYFDVLYDCRGIIQVLLRHDFVSNHVFGSSVIYVYNRLHCFYTVGITYYSCFCNIVFVLLHLLNVLLSFYVVFVVLDSVYLALFTCMMYCVLGATWYSFPVVL